MVVCGPTAAGKTGIALEIAGRFPVRLISADSVQVYRGLDVGSAKPPRDVLERFPHALIDIREPDEAYTAADFARDATAEIATAAGQGRIPVVVGGTALYLKALRYGLDPMPAADPEIRARIAAEAARRGWSALHRELAQLDPAAAERIGSGDKQRLQRALEIVRTTGRAVSEFHSGRGPDRLAGSVMLVVAAADRSVLHRRIERRWAEMLEQGLVDEVRGLLARPGLKRDAPAMRAVGYRQAVQCLDGAFGRSELAARGAAATRRLAKRQITAFRQWTGGMWYDPLNRTTIDRIINRVQEAFDNLGGNDGPAGVSGP